MLHLRQVEVRTRAALDELLCIMEEVETEVKERTGQGLIVDGDARLLEMPSARAAKASA